MNFVFVLVEPAVEQNIGACARALNTMGFSSLRLVNPRCDHLSENSRWMAHGSAALLETARTFRTLKEALRDVSFTVGTTARLRKSRQEYCPVRDLAESIRKKGRAAALTAVVFGCEEHGLSNPDLALCDMVSTVPIRSHYPSLNLAQAVMVYAYELSPLISSRKKVSAPDAMQYAALRLKVDELLNRIKFPASSSLHRRVVERLGLLPSDDLHLLHSVLTRVNSTLKSR